MHVKAPKKIKYRHLAQFMLMIFHSIISWFLQYSPTILICYSTASSWGSHCFQSTSCRFFTFTREATMPTLNCFTVKQIHKMCWAWFNSTGQTGALKRTNCKHYRTMHQLEKEGGGNQNKTKHWACKWRRQQIKSAERSNMGTDQETEGLYLLTSAFW